MWGDFPGLGKWPRPRPWRMSRDRRVRDKHGRLKPVRGVTYTRGSVRLPCITRIAHAPFTGCMYYEWYVPIDEDHYIYFQMTCYWPKNPLDWLWFHIRYFGYGRWTQLVRFNSQDVAMVGDSTDFAKRHGSNWPSRLYRPDIINITWREHVNTHARGEAVEPAAAEPKKEPAPAVVSQP